MSKVKEKNCRLCLIMLDDEYITINESVKEIFEILLLKVDLSVSEEPVLCKSCKESVKEAFDFTSTCISVDEQVISLSANRKSGELDIRDVYLKENENKSLSFNSICRFCLQCLEESNFNLLSDIRENSIGEMLHTCLPELDLNMIKQPVVCSACVKSLESYYGFVKECQNTEENIMKYREEQGAECNGQINLSEVLKFMIKDTPEYINCSKIAELKREDNLPKTDINNIGCKIEEEEIIIKDENKHGDRKTERKEVKCDICTFKTVHRAGLKRHMLTHKDSSDVIMFKCESCAFESKYKSVLKRHKIVHKDDSELAMYKCDLCSFKSKRKYALKCHMSTHRDSSDVVTYKCEKCTYQTKRKDYIKRHAFIHKDNSEVMLYKCTLHEMCTFETKYKDSLRRHLLIHKNNQ